MNMNLLIGNFLLNRYRVDSFLGRGGMAEVYKVWDNQRMIFLVMKVLHEDLALDRVFIRRFEREANTLAKLQHPNIVRLYGFEKKERLAFMLMDYIRLYRKQSLCQYLPPPSLHLLFKMGETEGVDYSR